MGKSKSDHDMELEGFRMSSRGCGLGSASMAVGSLGDPYMFILLALHLGSTF